MILNEEEYNEKRRQLNALRRQKEELNKQIRPLECEVSEWISQRGVMNAKAKYSGRCYKCVNENLAEAHNLPLAFKVLHVENHHDRAAFYCCGLRKNSISTEECIYLLESLKLTLMGDSKPIKIDCYKCISEEEFDALKQEVKERL